MTISLPLYIGGPVSCVILLFSISVYRLYFHPLATYPGPRTWALSHLPNAYNQLIGNLPYRNTELHQKYGPVVRISPNELTYATEKAWHDIYGKSDRKKPELRKDPSQFVTPPSGVHGLVFEPDEKEHARMRRIFSYGFTQKAVTDQEPVIMKNVNQLITKLRENCGRPIDMVDWYSFVTLDLIGELTFGESFGCLETSTLHFWPKILFSFLKVGSFFGLSKRFPPLDKILQFFAPASLRNAELQHREFTKAKVTKRLESQGTRSDFFSFAQGHYNTPGGITLDELVETSTIILLAGSDTSSTTLAGVTYYLLVNPLVLSKLSSEIRQAFKVEEDITISSVNSLHYQLAVLNETLRLLPPSAGTLARITPSEGCIIDGQFVPGNTSVGVNQWAAYHIPANFHRPYEFIPERWLGDDEFKDDNRQVMQPFSFGPRNCLGRALALTELRVVLAKMIWNFDMKLCEESLEWKDKMKIYMTYEKRPLKVILKSR